MAEAGADAQAPGYFDVAAEAYDRYMGRYSAQLSAQMADLAEVRAGQRVIDVGCGPGALTAELVGRVGADHVAAVDPSESFVNAARARHAGVDVRKAPAEHLPFPDAGFDAAIAQLVVHFMSDPAAGVAEMRRITRAGGTLAACVWDHASHHGPLSLFWDAAHELDADVTDESDLMGSREGQLVRLFAGAGIREVEQSLVHASVTYQTFEEWWTPFLGGVGPAGKYATSLGPEARDELREIARRLAGPAPFTVAARAWAARGRV